MDPNLNRILKTLDPNLNRILKILDPNLNRILKILDPNQLIKTHADLKDNLLKILWYRYLLFVE